MIGDLRAGFDYTVRIADLASEVGDGYTPKLAIVGTSAVSVDGAVEGEDIVFDLVAADTESFATGQYFYQVTAEADPDLRSFITEGTLWVKAYVSGDSPADLRSVAEKILAAIDARIQGKATADQQSYMIQSGGMTRSMSHLSMEDLLLARKLYASIVSQERRARNDQPLFKRHTFEFQKP